MEKERRRATYEKKEGVEVEFIIPKFDNSGNPVSPEYITKVIGEFTQIAGGVSVIPTIYGCWYDDERNTVQCEENTMVVTELSAERPSDFKEKLDKIKSLAYQVRRDLGQGQILYVVDDGVTINVIEGDYKPMSSKTLKKVRINILPTFIR